MSTSRLLDIARESNNIFATRLVELACVSQEERRSGRKAIHICNYTIFTVRLFIFLCFTLLVS